MVEQKLFYRVIIVSVFFFLNFSYKDKHPRVRVNKKKLCFEFMLPYFNPF